MVHKSRIIPGLSRFIDEAILSHYPATSMKRILAAGAVSLYLKQGDTMIDNLLSNPLFTGLGLNTADGMINLEVIRDTLKDEIHKAGMMRLSLPIVGDVDFTVEDIDALYNHITGANSSPVPTAASITTSGGGVY